jgi:hypothetical protein
MLPLRVFIVAILTAAPAIPEDRPVVGAVEVITGPVFLIAGDGIAEVPLNPRRDVLRLLFDGESLQCGPSGKAKIRIMNGGKEETKTITAADGVVRLKVDRALTPAQEGMVKALCEYGTPGGSRSVGSVVWSPPDGGAARIGNLKIRWETSSDEGPFTMTFSTEAGERIWSAAGIDAAAGRLPAAQEAAVRQALAQLQSDSDPQSVTLTVASKKKGRREITFSILSRRGEEHLQQQLSQWNEGESDPLLRAIGRAHSLSEALLYAEATEEYEAALALAPESDSLLRATMAANRRTGNLSRSRELLEKLGEAAR